MIFINYYSSVNALGNSIPDILKNLSDNHAPGMKESTHWLGSNKNAFYGNVLGELPVIADEFKRHNSRNNRLILAALQHNSDKFHSLIGKFSRNRVAVIMGTSTSGSNEANEYVNAVISKLQTPSDFQGWAQELGDPSRFLSAYLGLSGPAYTISTACTSSARSIISGARLIQSGMADAAIVGGADSLAKLPIHGFTSLEVMSRQKCRPFSSKRAGITIGEGAGVLVLSKEPSNLVLAGWGETSDAYHISSPHPQGAGIETAMREALAMARLQTSDIAYVNLHGTATRLNDSAEGAAVRNLFGSVPCSSTKKLTGHTLGAAGITEAALICALLDNPQTVLPSHFEDQSEMDEAFSGLGLLQNPTTLRGHYMMSNNIAFGGNNTSLILGHYDGK